jgi:hypothetical protein
VKRTIVVGLMLVAIAAALGLQTGNGTASTNDAVIQREADMYQLDQVEVKFHRATSHHDLKLMMSLWAPRAVFNIDQQALAGKERIQHWFATENKAFMPSHKWESDTPTYKMRITVTGDQATIYFECHYIDPKTATVVAVAGVTHTLQKINRQWLITNSAGSTATLTP